jgi:hypothetical protein
MRAFVTLFMFVLISYSVAAQSIYYVRTDGSDANTGTTNTSSGAKATLSAAITAASAGDIIQIGPGNYSGTGFYNLSLGTKYLRIIGSGSGSNPATSTIITGLASSSSSIEFMSMAKGASMNSPMLVSNMNLSGFAFYFSNVDSNSIFYNLTITGDSTYSQFGWRFANDAGVINVERCSVSNIWHWNAAVSNFKYTVSNTGQVFRSDNGNNLYNLNVRQCSFNSCYIGFYISQGSAPSSKKNADDITITNCSFSNMGAKAFYAERLDDLTISNCSFDNVGQIINSHPGAIDINLKWNTFSGDININYCYFNGCAIPNSGSDGNGAAILFKTRDFGSYASTPATFSGTFTVNGCILKNNNAGIRFGESHNGSGNGSGENSHSASATFTIKNSILQNNAGSSDLTYNRFGIRNVTTGAVNVTNCYFGGSSASTNTAFSGPIDVSNVNGGNGGSVNITGTLTTGDVIRLNGSDVYQADYTNLSSALSAAVDGNKIIVPPSSISGTTTISNNVTLITPGAGRLYASHRTSFNNLTVSGSKTLTTGSDFQVTGALTVSASNGLALGKYYTFDLAGTITSGGTFTGGVTSGDPNSELLVSGSGNITIPTFVNGLSVLNINRGVSDVISLGGNMSINNMEFTNATLNLNGFKLTVNGVVISNTSSLTGTTSGSELEIAGTSRTFQLGAGTFQNLTVNRNQGVQLSGDVTVNNVLTLSNGSLILGNFNCTLESGATINGTPSASKMIIATGTGQLRKKFTATGSFTFPVGDDVSTFEFSPVTLNFTSGTFGSGALAGVNLSNVKHPSNVSGTHFLNRYWTVSQTNITAFSCNTSFTYVDADINGTESNLFGGKHSSSVWTNLGAVNTTSNLITGTVTSFSDFTAGETTALPVSWLNVSAEKQGKQDVVVKWSTANELDNDYFEIQYAENGLDFKTAGFQKGAGTTLSQTAYDFLHSSALANISGALFYRIKQVDYNGDFSYSNIVSVKAESMQEVVVYPVPLTSATTVELPAATDVISVSLTNAYGAVTVIPQDNYKQYLKTINLSNLNSCAPGMYWLEIRTVSGVFYAKVLRQH